MRHLLKHEGKKPLPCDQCDASCTTLSNLQRHQKTHNTDNKRNDIQNSSDVNSDMIDYRKEIVVNKTDITGDQEEANDNAIDDILYSMDLTPEVVCKETKSNTIDDLLDSKDVRLKDVDDVDLKEDPIPLKLTKSGGNVDMNLDFLLSSNPLRL